MSLILDSIQLIDYDALLFNKDMVTKRLKCIPLFQLPLYRVLFLVFISEEVFLINNIEEKFLWFRYYRM